MLEVGDVVGGKLRVERMLGAGGMGVVAVATHLQLDQKVALKVLHDRLAADRGAVERLIREARAVARLRSEHVCRVLDVGELPSGAPFIVMELLEGRDLARVIANSPPPVATAIDYVVQACVGLAEAHARGIVHRDLKPANLFLTTRLDGSPLIKVLDFGIAKAPSGSDTGLTQTDTVMGTPGYMAPEQLRSTRDVDARADIWALGVVLYQALTGRLPFPATSLAEIAVQIAMDEPQPLDAPPALRDVILRCLEKNPAARYRDVAELARALAPFGGPSAARDAELARTLLAGSAGHAETLPSGAGLAPTVATTLGTAAAEASPVAAEPSRPVSTNTRRRTRLAIAAGAVAAIAAGVAVFALRSSDADRVADVKPAEPVVSAPATLQVAPPTPDAPTVATATQAPAPAPAPPHNIASSRRTPPAAPAAAPAVSASATTNSAAATTMSLAEIRQAAREASIPGDWELELHYLDMFLKAKPDDESALVAAAIAACRLDQPDPARARGYARTLMPKARRMAEIYCEPMHIDLSAPEAPQLKQDLAVAVAKHRCGKILELSYQLGGADPRKPGEACAATRKLKVVPPGNMDADAEDWLQGELDDLHDGHNDENIPGLRALFYEGRAAAFCRAHDSADARSALSHVDDAATVQRVHGACTAAGTAL